MASEPASPEARDLLGRAYGLTARGSHVLEQMRLAGRRGTASRAPWSSIRRMSAALADLARYDMQAPGVLGGGKKKARETDRFRPRRSTRLWDTSSWASWRRSRKTPPRAEVEYRSAVAADPSSPRGRLALSDFFVARRDYGKARRVWAEMLELDATSPWPAYALAGVALASGEGLGPAAGDLETLLGHEAWSGDPTPAQCRARLADVDERLGKSTRRSEIRASRLPAADRRGRRASDSRARRRAGRRDPPRDAVPFPGRPPAVGSEVSDLPDGARMVGRRPVLRPVGVPDHRNLVETAPGPNYFSAFYARRVLRIVPLYVVAVFLLFRVALPLARRIRPRPRNGPVARAMVLVPRLQLALGVRARRDARVALLVVVDRGTVLPGVAGASYGSSRRRGWPRSAAGSPCSPVGCAASRRRGVSRPRPSIG